MSSRDNESSNAGTEKWTFETGDWVQSSPTVANGTVYFGSNDDYMYAVDATTGAERWRFKTRSRVESSPTVVDNTVYVGSNDGNLYAVDAATGAQRWDFRCGGNVSYSPVVADEMVYVTGVKNVYAVDAATGTGEWSFRTGDLVKSSPTVVDGTVYIGGGDNLYALDATTGTEEWSFEAGDDITASPMVGNGTVYFGGDNLYAVNATTGTQEWYYKSRLNSSPTIANGTVYVGSGYNLCAVGAATGTEEWVFETASKNMVKSSPAVVDGTVYVGGGNKLYAVDVVTGAEKWVFKTGDSINSSPTVANGTVYVGSRDTNLYAITASPEPANGGGQRPQESDGKDQIPDIEDMRSPQRRSLSFENLQTIEDIDEGGQAVIKKARLTDSKAPPEVVALRQPPTSKTLTLTTDGTDKFLRRAEIWETIDGCERDKRRWRDSEHIVGVIDTGNDPFPWIAMEYMGGGDLGELLDEHPGGLPVGQALWIGECVCKGLKVADKLGICHLDVKPENVLLKQTDKWPWPKLADWGLARNLVKETGSKQELSPEYAAPEQLNSDKFDDLNQLTDIYQTGALVYALLTGDPPMSEGSIPAPSERRSTLSTEVDAAVGLALEREKLDRYDSIADFREALTAIRTGERPPREVARRVEE